MTDGLDIQVWAGCIVTARQWFVLFDGLAKPVGCDYSFRLLLSEEVNNNRSSSPNYCELQSSIDINNNMDHI